MRPDQHTLSWDSNAEWQGLSALQIIQAIVLVATFGTILGAGLIHSLANWGMGQRPFRFDGNDAWFSGYLLKNSADAAGRSHDRIG